MIYRIGSNECVTYDGLKTQLTEGLPIILDFSAKWCGPCKKLYPLLEILSSNFKDIYIYKIDISESDDDNLGDEYDISALPTMIYIHNNNVIYKDEGFNPNCENLINYFSRYYINIDSHNTDDNISNTNDILEMEGGEIQKLNKIKEKIIKLLKDDLSSKSKLEING